MLSTKIFKIIAVIFSGLLGLIFLLSAYTKLYPIEPFEYTFVELGIGGWKSSVILARLFIGLEFACGLLLLGNLWLRRFTIPFVGFILVVFNIYLTILIIKFGNKGNCGCFGDFFQLTPLEGILKNIVMLVFAAFIYFFHKGFYFSGIKSLTYFFIIASISTPFILNPVNFEISQQHYTKNLYYKLELDLLYNDADNTPPKVELRKGKWIIAFMSLKCPHCRVAAKKLHVMKHKNPDLPIYLVLNGKKENIQPFFEDTRADNINWSLFIGAPKFIKLAGTQLPEIVWVNNSVVENKIDYFFLEQDEIENWLKNEK